MRAGKPTPRRMANICIERRLGLTGVLEGYDRSTIDELGIVDALEIEVSNLFVCNRVNKF